MIGTERLILRGWRDADLAPFAALNADPEVMRHFPAVLSRAETAALIGRITEHILREGYGFWAVERREDGMLLGACGLAALKPENPLFPGVEVGWRFARHAWGRGYASEAAKACLAHGFAALSLQEIVAFTAVANLRSEAVMRRIGMVRDEARDFEHPAVPPGHRLRAHIVYAARP